MNKRILSFIIISLMVSFSAFADITGSEHSAMWHPEKSNSNGYSTTAEVDYHLHTLGSEVHVTIDSELHFLTRTQLYHLDGRDISTYPLPLEIKEDLSNVNSYILEADVMDSSYAFGTARFTLVSSTQNKRQTSERLSYYSGISEEELLGVYKTENLRLTNFRIIEIDFATTYVNRLRRYLQTKERETQRFEEAKDDIAADRYDEAISKLKLVTRNSPELSGEAETLLAETLSQKEDAEEAEKSAREEEQERMIQESSISGSDSLSRNSAPSQSADSSSTGSSWALPSTTYANETRESSGMTTAELYSLIDDMERDREIAFAKMDRGTQRIIDTMSFDRQWSSSSNLDTYGKSPEELIRDVERKKDELDDLAAERRADFNRQIAEFKQENSDNAYGDVVALTGQVVGNISLENQKKKAQRELDEQLTEAFEDIRDEINEDVDERLDVAYEARAETLLPIEYDYYDDIITYYGNYKRKMSNSFSIKNTSWTRPSGSLPDKPRIPSNPSLTRSEAESFMETKYELVREDDQYSDEAEYSLRQLSAYTTKTYPDSSAGFYYASLMKSDALDSFLLANRAYDLNKNNYKYRDLKDDKWSDLNSALFNELSRGRTDIAGRCYELDLLMQLRNSRDENPYIFALNNNVAVLDTLLGYVPSAERSDLVQSLMYLAAGKGLDNRMATLVSRGADVNGANNQTGWTPFLIAADNEKTSTMELFLTEYAVDIQNQLSRADRYSLDNAGYQTALYLLEKAYETDEPELLGRAVEFYPRSSYGRVDESNNWISASIVNEKPNLLRYFLESGLSPDSGNLQGKPALLVAMDSKASDDIFSLLEQEGTSFYPTLENGDTLLHWAIEEDRPLVRELWFIRSMDGNIKNNRGKTALHSAAEKGDAGAVLYLLDKNCDALLIDDLGRLPLHFGSTELHGEAFDALLDGSNGTDYPDSKGTTPLHLALDAGDRENAEKLLKTDPWIDQQDEKGRTYLLSSMDSLPELIPALLEHNPDVNIKDDSGKTAMHRALNSRSRQKIDALMPFHPDVNLTDNEGKTVLGLALQTEYPLWRTLIQDGSPSWFTQDSEGISPAFTLVSRNTPDAMDWLEPEGINLTLATGTGETLFHGASRSGNSDMMEALLRLAPDENLLNQQESLFGETPLHLAVRTGNLELVELLLENKADGEVENGAEQTPSDLAFDLGLPSIGSTIKYYGDEKKIASYNEKLLKGGESGMKDRNWAAISSFTVAGVGALASTWFYVEGTNSYYEYQNNPYSSTMDSYRSAVEFNSQMLGYSLATAAGGFVSGVLSIVIPKIFEKNKTKEEN